MIKKKIEEILKKIAPKDISFLVEIPKEKSYGDYSTNLALIIAKQERKNLQDVAKRIIAEIGEMVAVRTTTDSLPSYAFVITGLESNPIKIPIVNPVIWYVKEDLLKVYKLKHDKQT